MSEVPKGRKLIGAHWLFKFSGNRVYRVHLVAQGFSQVHGIDITESSAAVLTDEVFHLLLTKEMKHDFCMAQLDVKTAFLYGDLLEEISMKCPDGLFWTQLNVSCVKKIDFTGLCKQQESGMLSSF